MRIERRVIIITIKSLLHDKILQYNYYDY